MASRLVIDVFCEDSGHETFLRNLIKVLAKTASVPTPEMNLHSSRGGHGRAIKALKAWQKALRSSQQPRGDALLVRIDANSTGWRRMRRYIQDAVDSSLHPNVLIGCPDPHVEVWCTADPEAFQSLFSVPVPSPPSQSGRLVYKQWLTTALEQAGVLVLTDPMDICLDLLPAMDLSKACQNNDSLDSLIRDVRAFLNRQRLV
ncbi:MAG: hypothetical protein ACK587_02470 [Cyanobacteriota bacterium]